MRVHHPGPSIRKLLWVDSDSIRGFEEMQAQPYHTTEQTIPTGYHSHRNTKVGREPSIETLVIIYHTTENPQKGEPFLGCIKSSVRVVGLLQRRTSYSERRKSPRAKAKRQHLASERDESKPNGCQEPKREGKAPIFSVYTV